MVEDPRTPLEALTPEELEQSFDERLAEALPHLDAATASLWLEIGANRPGRADAEVLERAARDADGVRRLVLLRRVADLHVFAGRPDAALTTVRDQEHPPSKASPIPLGPAGRLLASQARAPLDCWEQLTREEALLAIDAVRAEALSHLVRTEDASRAFAQLESRLVRLAGPTSHELWIAWTRGWGWFCTEILGRPDRTLAACAQVRTRLGEACQAPRLAMPLLRAEIVACSSLGDTSRAAALTDEHLRLAEAANDAREACLAWNARGIQHVSQGELATAGRAFERAIELSRTASWLRREAISTHNLALVLTEQGEWEPARELETRYGRLSVTIGNHAGRAEAPAVLAAAALGRGALAEADALIAQARRAAEDNGWTMLVAWSRALAGRARLQAWSTRRERLDLTQARNELLASAQLLEETACAWTEELDPGEVYALGAACLMLSGQREAARAHLERGRARLPSQVPVAQRSIAVGAALVEGEDLDEALRWFAERGYRRRVATWTALRPERGSPT